MCTSDKSFYCDLECYDDSESADNLLEDLGGLWCDYNNWNGCRICSMNCSDYGGDCVPCPEGLKDWC